MISRSLPLCANFEGLHFAEMSSVIAQISSVQMPRDIILLKSTHLTGPPSPFTTPPTSSNLLPLLLLDVSLSFYDRLACLCCALRVVLFLFYLTCCLLLLLTITFNDFWARSVLSCPSHIWKESICCFFFSSWCCLEISLFNRLFFFFTSCSSVLMWVLDVVLSLSLCLVFYFFF